MNRVPLNNVDHHDLAVVAGHAPEHGDSVNLVLLLPTEFVDAAREYPILLRRDGGGAFYATALLGLDRDENLFLTAAGWEARYVPAVRRCGPFSIVAQESDAGPEPMVHVDLDDPRVGRQGLPVFLPHGGNSPYLDYVTAALRTIRDGIEVAPALYAALDRAGLIEPVTLEVKLSDTEQYDLSGFHTVGQAALAGLDGETLAALNRSGFLAAAFTIAWSMGNMGRLIDLKNRKEGRR